jgi:endonuclease YncB( thermonuclease family)
MSERMRRRATPSRKVLSLAVLIGLSAVADAALAASIGAGACRPAAEEHATVRAAIDARTLDLADGSEVRLAGLEDLAAFGPGTGPGPGLAAGRAKAALDILLRGKPIRLQSLGSDRYGRRVALVVRADSATGAAVQQELLASGHAVASGRLGHTACAAAFLSAERTARAARLGLWSDPYYEVGQAERPAELLAMRGRFALVEGKVLSIGDRRAIVYLNFGRRWSEDFTVTILKRNERHFIAAGLEPKALADHRIRVRGWIDDRGGPWIEATSPDQIELAD